MLNQKQSLKPWYKQFWPCFLFAFPLSAVIAGIITFVIAQNHSPALVSGNYYKEGLAINANKALEANANKMGLVARVVATPTTLTLHMTGIQLLEPSLLVELQHPAFNELDQNLILPRITDGVYQSPVHMLKKGKWYLRVKNQSNTWVINKTFFISDN